MCNSVASDSTMYICILDELKIRGVLIQLLEAYEFYIGENVIKETKIFSRDDELMKKVKTVKYDYLQLLKPFLLRKRNHYRDGEYEVIGIAYFLEQRGDLKYLILDEKHARNFVKANFRRLFSKLVGTVGFLRDSCLKDNVLEPSNVIEILNNLKKLIEQNASKRPCSLDMKNYEKILIPIIEFIREEAGIV